MPARDTLRRFFNCGSSRPQGQQARPEPVFNPPYNPAAYPPAADIPNPAYPPPDSKMYYPPSPFDPPKQAASATYASPPGPSSGPSYVLPPQTASDWSAPPPPPPPPFDLNEEDAPPPAFYSLHEESPASNASEALANAGWEFTRTHVLFTPTHWSPSQLAAIAAGRMGLAPPPPHFQGLTTKVHDDNGAVQVSAAPGCRDTCLISALPLFAAGHHHPSRTGVARAVYYEVAVHALPARTVDAAVAIGYVATPYPGFRLPGWNRGSLAVHGDDGRRYTNDSFGGREFVAPFKEGDTVGLGMCWGAGKVASTSVWFTRNGKVEGRWMLEEERDAREENDTLEGLAGDCDVFAAIGVYGGELRVGVKFFSDNEIRDRGYL